MSDEITVAKDKGFDTKTELKRNLIGGGAGGVLGYLFGYMADSSFLSVVLFFVVAYLGYNVRAIVSAFRDNFVPCVKAFWKGVKTMNPHPLISLIPMFWIGGLVFGSMTSGTWIKSSTYGFWPHQWWPYVTGLWEWAFTGHHSLGGVYGQFSFDTRMFMTIAWAVVSAAVGTVAWGVSGRALKSGLLDMFKKLAVVVFSLPNRIFDALIKVTWAGIKSTGKTAVIAIACGIYMSCFYLTIGLLITVAKGLALTIMGIHSVRRLACGLACLAGGIVYLVFVPFSFQGAPVAVLAIGCGIACAGTCALVAVALDGEAVYNALQSFVKKPIATFVPGISVGG